MQGRQRYRLDPVIKTGIVKLLRHWAVDGDAFGLPTPGAAKRRGLPQHGCSQEQNAAQKVAGSRNEATPGWQEFPGDPTFPNLPASGGADGLVSITSCEPTPEQIVRCLQHCL